MADMKRIGGNARKVYKWNDDIPSKRPSHATKTPSTQPAKWRPARKPNVAALLQWVLVAFVVCVMVLLSIFAIGLKTSEIQLSKLEKEWAKKQQKVVNKQDELDYAKYEGKVLTDAGKYGLKYPPEDSSYEKTIALPARATDGTLASR